MAIGKKVFLFLGIFIYILTARIIKIILFPIKPCRYFRVISSWTRIFSRFLRAVINIRVTIEGGPLPLNEKGILVVCNHLGYLDGIILGSLLEFIYTSKSEVMRWPIFGILSLAGETIFIDRKRKSKSPDYVQEVTAMLKKKVSVLVFAEGTSTNGEQLRPFQSIHFQAPLDAAACILPLNITYTKIDKEGVGLKNRNKVCWYGQTSFYQHILGVLKLKSIEAKVTVHPKIDSAQLASTGLSRKDLGGAIHKVIAGDYPLFK